MGSKESDQDVTTTTAGVTMSTEQKKKLRIVTYLATGYPVGKYSDIWAALREKVPNFLYQWDMKKCEETNFSMFEGNKTLAVRFPMVS